MITLHPQNIVKTYRLYSKPIDSLKELIFRKDYHQKFHALSGVKITLETGKTIGIIGENGAGKSTLLKLLSGTIAPTHGTLEQNGRLSAILELGSGFHDDLSGRENIEIGCAVIGLSPSETKARMPEIIEFSELGEFIDRPVKTYSSGMLVRLGFSVVTSVNPDILIVDEALSVGDQHFQQKSLRKMLSFKEQGKSLIFCSHNLYQIKLICDECLWLKHGKPEMYGPSDEVVSAYQNYQRGQDLKNNEDFAVSALQQEITGENKEHENIGDTEELINPSENDIFQVMEHKEKRAMLSEQEPSGDEELEGMANNINSSKADEITPKSYLLPISLKGDIVNNNIETGQNLIIDLTAELAESHIGNARIAVLIRRNDNIDCYAMCTEIDGISTRNRKGNRYYATLKVEDIPLLTGEYYLDVFLIDNTTLHIYDIQKPATTIIVKSDNNEVGVSRIPHSWR
jgi:ABC-type polysaccharide/polyol phosphate transport system ATPase subunit